MNAVLIACIALVVAVLVSIFCLAAQSTTGTQRLAWRIEQLLIRFVPPTGTGEVGEPTWFGLTIRRLAHVAEYGALGLATRLMCGSLLKHGIHALGAAIALCAMASVADEMHKHFVPGRHFDPADLALDAIGYLSAILVASGVMALGAALR